jgi:hypothetical protein
MNYFLQTGSLPGRQGRGMGRYLGKKMKKRNEKRGKM